MTVLVVVATGNHYFLDTVAGAVLAGLTWVVVNRVSAWLTVQLALHKALVGPSLLRPEHAALLLGLYDRALRRLAGAPNAAAGTSSVPHPRHLHRAEPHNGGPAA